MISRIKKIMETKELNAAQFADEIGVQRSALSHVLSGRNNPSLDFMLKIKTAYPEINLDWLLIGSGNMMENIDVGKPKQEIEEKFGRELDFLGKDSNAEEEEKVTTPYEKPLKAVKKVIENLDSPSGKILVKVILLYSDKTFEQFDAPKKVQQ